MAREGTKTRKSNEELSAIAQMVRDARHAAGLSQAKLGQRCGMGQGRISSIECSIVCPSVKDLERIAAALGKELVVKFK